MADPQEQTPDGKPEPAGFATIWGVAAGTVLLTASAGLCDAWTYIAHGGALATTQSGNVLLMMVAVANHSPRWLGHLSSLVAFTAGLLVSRWARWWLHQVGRQSRFIRLVVVCLLLLALAVLEPRLSDGAITAWIGFAAGIQITSLSKIDGWTFNTGMTTGNLRGAATALVNAATGDRSSWLHAGVMIAICIAFAGGVLLGATLTPLMGARILLIAAGLVASAIGFTAMTPDGLHDN